MPLLTRRQAPPPQRRLRLIRPRALTAAAEKPSRDPASLRRLNQAWHPRALGYYNTVGECWYPAQFYARAMQRIRFFPAILNDAGEPEEVETGPLRDLYDAIQDPGGGGNSGLAKSYGQLRFLIGDGYLVVSEDDGEEVWEYLSPLELRALPKTRDDVQQYRRLRAPGATQEELVEASDSDFAPLTGQDVRVWRLYRRHPSFSQWSDSPVRAVLDLYALLMDLTLAAGGESRSRAANRGMLFITDELTLEPLTPEDVADDEDPEADPFVTRLAEGYARAIENPGSAEAMMPFIARGPGTIDTATGKALMKEAMGWMALGPADRYAEGDMWDKTINRIAGGLDMPREMVGPGGVGAQNHWTGWLVDEQGFRQHVAPVAEEFCQDVASAYLRPAAEEANLDNADRVIIWYDPVAAIIHPDESAVAKDAYDRYAISWATYRDRTGFTEDDAPSQAEIDERVNIEIRRRALIPPEVADVPVGEGETPPQEGGTGGDTTEAPPPQPTETPAGRNGGGVTAAALLSARIDGAAHLAVERARERAGNMMRRKAQSCPECMEAIHGVPSEMVMPHLGAEQARAVLDGHGSERALVAGAGEMLARQLSAWGVNDGWPEKLGRMVEDHALRSLYEPVAPELPAGFAAAVARALR